MKNGTKRESVEPKKSRWNQKRVGGTKKESVEQKKSPSVTLRESVPCHPGPTIKLKSWDISEATYWLPSYKVCARVMVC